MTEDESAATWSPESRRRVEDWLRGLQQRLLKALCEEDASLRLRRDPWRHPDGGGGLSCVLCDGEVFEQGGVNFSHVRGASLPPAALAEHPEFENRGFRAMGVSLVLHPRNPHVPISHANLRYFETVPAKGEAPHWWFGGGFDLTPCYGYEEDARHWHTVARRACAPFGKDLYPRYKRACDEYFFLPHRGETRGIGGLFFDQLCTPDFAHCFAFLCSVGEHYLPAYLPIVRRRAATPYGESARHFQLYRRGRYVEFNLLFDRGTRFGLESGGRTESILMSLPPLARWEYGFEAEPGSPEARLVEEFLRPREWL